MHDNETAPTDPTLTEAAIGIRPVLAQRDSGSFLLSHQTLGNFSPVTLTKSNPISQGWC